MSLHIYTAPRQPFTRYVDHILLGMGYSRRQATRRHHPRAQVRCHVCGRRRWARNLIVCVYYDHVLVACQDRCRRRRR